MKPKVLLLGGCGFIGRNLVDHLVRENEASEVCVVDKVPPQTAWLSETHKASFNDERVTFQSANLINPDSCKAAFLRQDGDVWDWVINCAGETRLGQSDGVCEEGIAKLSVLCAKQAEAAGAKIFLEFSTCMASNKKVPHCEKDSCEPFSRIAKLKSQVEKELNRLSQLQTIILRPAIVYGPGDRTGLMPLLMLGGIYKQLGESMRLLYSRDVHMNTVHVNDVCRAAVFLMSRAQTDEALPKSETFHLVDDSKSTQGTICDAVSEIFRVETGHFNAAISGLAKTDLESVADDVNDKHLPPWAAMCSNDKITNTPLSPYIFPESLKKQHVNMDGTKLKQLGFNYLYPYLTVNSLLQIMQDYINMNLFPKSCLS